MTIGINGMAHVILTVSRFDAARAFYRKLLPEFGMKPVHDGDRLFYCVGARAAIGIQPSDPALTGERFVQQRVGLHHLCLRARSREDVDRCAALLKEIGAKMVRGPMEGSWAPGYYYVLFEDPDGIRLEVNFVPGAGLLAEGVHFQPRSGLRPFRRQLGELEGSLPRPGSRGGDCAEAAQCGFRPLLSKPRGAPVSADTM